MKGVLKHITHAKSQGVSNFTNISYVKTSKLFLLTSNLLFKMTTSTANQSHFYELGQIGIQLHVTILNICLGI